MKQFAILVLSALFLLPSCAKEGPGGESTLTGHVRHHDEAIPGATVYIKYGEKEFPGTDAAAYDDQTSASLSDAHYEFSGLEKGDYYLYSAGYDSTISDSVFGGLSVSLGKGETREINVPVTE